MLLVVALAGFGQQNRTHALRRAAAGPSLPVYGLSRYGHDKSRSGR